MSIFPKRTVRGKTVTIHWNFNTAALKEVHIYPFVRIGVKDPAGNVTMLLEQHLLALPPVAIAHDVPQDKKSLYLNKNTPLLILADYLSGAYKKEVLSEILQHIQDGKHFYFSYPVPADAPLGKYTLISELYNEGHVKYSKTASDDFFFVEEVSVQDAAYTEGKGVAILENKSPEKTPVRMIEYRQQQLTQHDVTTYELLPYEKRQVHFNTLTSFLNYNEERIFIPLWPNNEPSVLRNQQLISIEKETGEGPAVFLLERDGNEGTKLTEKTKALWDKADGLSPVSVLKQIDPAAYDEMVAAGLLIEIKNSHLV